jgi:hypothetical protein
MQCISARHAEIFASLLGGQTSLLSDIFFCLSIEQGNAVAVDDDDLVTDKLSDDFATAAA